MNKKYISKKKVEAIMNELGKRKEAGNYKFLAAKSDDEDIIGNVSACTDCDDDSGTDGGAGNVSGCADDVCSDIIGNVSGCTDCDDTSGTGGGAGNVSGCADDVCS